MKWIIARKEDLLAMYATTQDFVLGVANNKLTSVLQVKSLWESFFGNPSDRGHIRLVKVMYTTSTNQYLHLVTNIHRNTSKMFSYRLFGNSHSCKCGIDIKYDGYISGAIVWEYNKKAIGTSKVKPLSPYFTSTGFLVIRLRLLGGYNETTLRLEEMIAGNGAVTEITNVVYSTQSSI